MTFEKFVKVGRDFVPKVSIGKRGRIGFNQIAVDKLEMSGYQFGNRLLDPHALILSIHSRPRLLMESRWLACHSS